VGYENVRTAGLILRGVELKNFSGMEFRQRNMLFAALKPFDLKSIPWCGNSTVGHYKE
jgi:hypothetical protein